MAENEQLATQLREITSIVQEMIEIVQHEAKEFERFATWVEQQTSLRDTPKELRVTASRLAELHRRAKKLSVS